MLNNPEPSSVQHEYKDYVTTELVSGSRPKRRLPSPWTCFRVSPAAEAKWSWTRSGQHEYKDYVATELVSGSPQNVDCRHPELVSGSRPKRRLPSPWTCFRVSPAAEAKWSWTRSVQHEYKDYVTTELVSGSLQKKKRCWMIWNQVQESMKLSKSDSEWQRLSFGRDPETSSVVT